MKIPETIMQTCDGDLSWNNCKSCPGAMDCRSNLAELPWNSGGAYMLWQILSQKNGRFIEIDLILRCKSRSNLIKNILLQICPGIVFQARFNVIDLPWNKDAGTAWRAWAEIVPRISYLTDLMWQICPGATILQLCRGNSDLTWNKR